MSLDPALRSGLRLPAICAPMFLVSGPELVREACKAGLIAGLPRANARSEQEFAGWLSQIQDDLQEHAALHPHDPVGPVAANLKIAMSAAEMDRHLDLCRRNGVQIVITAGGDPTRVARQVHDHGLRLFHDITSLRFAEKAIAAGADGLTCIGAGGGGHSGLIGHLSLIPKIRSMFDGTIVLAGSVSTGAAIRAAEILGADLSYLGTRFIATQESLASPDYKSLLVRGSSSDLIFTAAVAGVPANWLIESLRLAGLDPDDLPQPHGRGRSYDHLPATARPWKHLWSAGQGIDLIDDVPTVAELVERLSGEYADACAIPAMAAATRLVEEVDALD